MCSSVVCFFSLRFDPSLALPLPIFFLYYNSSQSPLVFGSKVGAHTPLLKGKKLLLHPAPFEISRWSSRKMKKRNKRVTYFFLRFVFTCRFMFVWLFFHFSFIFRFVDDSLLSPLGFPFFLSSSLLFMLAFGRIVKSWCIFSLSLSPQSLVSSHISLSTLTTYFF